MGSIQHNTAWHSDGSTVAYYDRVFERWLNYLENRLAVWRTTRAVLTVGNTNLLDLHVNGDVEFFPDIYFQHRNEDHADDEDDDQPLVGPDTPGITASFGYLYSGPYHPARHSRLVFEVLRFHDLNLFIDPDLVDYYAVEVSFDARLYRMIIISHDADKDHVQLRIVRPVYPNETPGLRLLLRPLPMFMPDNSQLYAGCWRLATMMPGLELLVRDYRFGVLRQQRFFTPLEDIRGVATWHPIRKTRFVVDVPLPPQVHERTFRLHSAAGESMLVGVKYAYSVGLLLDNTDESVHISVLQGTYPDESIRNMQAPLHQMLADTLHRWITTRGRMPHLHHIAPALLLRMLDMHLWLIIPAPPANNSALVQRLIDDVQKTVLLDLEHAIRIDHQFGQRLHLAPGRPTQCGRPCQSYFRQKRD